MSSRSFSHGSYVVKRIHATDLALGAMVKLEQLFSFILSLRGCSLGCRRQLDVRTEPG